MKISNPGHRGYTLVEMLVVVALIGLLAAVVVPVSRAMMVRGRAVRCHQNLRQIGQATLLYLGDNDMILPATSHQRGGRSWTLTLQPYAAGTIVFKCPDDPDGGRSYTYVLNDFLTPNPAGADHLDFSRLVRIKRPELTMMFAEAMPRHGADHFHFAPYAGGRLPLEVFSRQVAASVHGGSSSYLFADGHAEILPWTEVRGLLLKDGSSFVDPTR